MSLFIQLMIVSVVAVMVQSNPVPSCELHRDQILANANKQDYLYCVTNSLKKTIVQLNSTLNSSIIVNVPEIDRVVTNTTMAMVLKGFSKRCTSYTKAMSLKHWLQDYLLNDNIPVLNDCIKSNDCSEPYSSVLVFLQTIANIFDDLEFSEDKKHCVTLAAAHYKKHFLTLTAAHYKKTQHDNASLLDVMLTEIMNWHEATKKEMNGLPHVCFCKIVYPTKWTYLIMIWIIILFNPTTLIPQIKGKPVHIALAQRYTHCLNKACCILYGRIKGTVFSIQY